MMIILKKIDFSRFGIGLAFVAEMILFAILSPYFLTAENLLNVSLQASITAIIAAGMTFVILTGGIDLSVGSVVALAGIAATASLKAGLPPWVPLPAPLQPAALLAVGLLAGLGVGALSGALAGVGVTRFRVTPFIMTLALMTIGRGAAFVATGGRPVWELPESFGFLGSGRLFHIPIPSLIMLAVYGITHVALTRTRFGRYVYAVGGNPEAARLAGIRTGWVLLRVYLISGVLAALSGILLASRMNSGQPNAGLMYELDVIAAVVIGGTSLSGGRGTIAGTFAGSMLIAVLRNGLNMLNIGSYVQQVIVGVVILLAVLMDQFRSK